MAYIDADKVINELMEKQCDDITEQIGIYKAVVMLYRALAAETADVQEVKHGEGVPSEYQPHHTCSICGHWFSLYDKTNYCPNCGAKMDGGSE